MSLQLWCLIPATLVLILAILMAILQIKLEEYKAKKKAEKAEKAMDKVKQQALKMAEKHYDLKYLRRSKYAHIKARDYYRTAAPPPPPPPPRRPSGGVVTRSSVAYLRHRGEEELARIMKDKMPKIKDPKDYNSIW
jgi:hypothetical protein